MGKNKAMNILDSWVKSVGSGSYVDPNFEPLTDLKIPEDFGIQQVREELNEFVEVIYENIPPPPTLKHNKSS